MAKRERGLGRGFDTLIPTAIVETEFDVQAAIGADGKRVEASPLREVDPALIDPNPHQPRLSFDEVELQELADSIRVHGVLQPMVVCEDGERYQLIAGERRLRASKLAGLEVVPVIVRSFDEQQKLEVALIENLQRADLNPIETATAYKKLIDQFNLTQAAIGERVGHARPTIANTLRLLGLPLEVKRAVAEGRLSEGHARVVMTVVEPEKQIALAKLIEERDWTVRQAEEYARGLRGETGSKEKAEARISRTNDLTKSLETVLGAKVQQVTTAKGGRLLIEYTSEEELERITRLIRREA